MSWEQNQAGWQLVVIDGPAAGRRLPITGSVTVGRASEMTLSLPQDGYLSGRHVRFEAAATGLLVTDTGSTNGTYLNGERVGDATAFAGDQVRVGSVTMAVEGPLQRPNASQQPGLLQQPGPPQQADWMQQPPTQTPQPAQPAFASSPFFNAPDPAPQQPMWGQPSPEPQSPAEPSWAQPQAASRQGFGQPASSDWSGQPNATPRAATAFEAPLPFAQAFAPWDSPQVAPSGQERSPWEFVAPSLSQASQPGSQAGSQPGSQAPVQRAPTVLESRPEAWLGFQPEPPPVGNAPSPWDQPQALPPQPAPSGRWGEHPPAPSRSPQVQQAAEPSQPWTPSTPPSTPLGTPQSTPSPWESHRADQPSPWAGFSPAAQPMQAAEAFQPPSSTPAADPWHSLRQPEPFALEPSFQAQNRFEPSPVSEPAVFHAEPAPVALPQPLPEPPRAGWQDSPWASFGAKPEPPAPANVAEAIAALELPPLGAQPPAIEPLLSEPSFESFLESEPSHAPFAPSEPTPEPALAQEPSRGEPTGAFAAPQSVAASQVVAAPQSVAASEPSAAPEPAPVSPAHQPGSATAEAALNILSALQTPLFALVDAAADPAIPDLLQRAAQQVPMQSLFEGERAVSLARWAPYLVDLRPGIPASGAVLAELIRRGWGRGWASYFISPASFAELRNRLRPLLTVRVEGGADAYFRFYDPRVLRDHLPAERPRELDAFFGPIEAWFLEGQDGERLFKMNAGPDGRLVQRSAALTG